MNSVQNPGNLALSILFFPLFFQGLFLDFAWGAEDEFWIMAAKRLFLLLPVLAVILACWATVGCCLSLIVRQNRRQFATALFVTWWDLGRAIFSFWAGIFRFCVFSVAWGVALVRLLVVGLWFSAQDVLMSPIRLAGEFGKQYVRPGVPWLAFAMTLGWSAMEAGVFTYVTSPLVMDVLSGMSGRELTESMVMVPLYLAMLGLVLGSYAVLSTWGDAVKSRDVGKIVQIGIVEAIVLGFEVMFLYREFVDALVPWFAQHSSGEFNLGITGMLAIAAFAWFGVRGMTWFLFAGAGTPMIMSIIQRTGIKNAESVRVPEKTVVFAQTATAINRIRDDMDWVHTKGNEFLGAFILPPLQIVAAAANFLSLLIVGNHLFDIPFQSVQDVATAKVLLKKLNAPDKVA